jgi:hypothetical protein
MIYIIEDWTTLVRVLVRPVPDSIGKEFSEDIVTLHRYFNGRWGGGQDFRESCSD